MTSNTIESSAIQVLHAFGLTTNQAKIYLAIAHSKADTVRAICEASNIPLESIYRIMPSLEEMNLVKRVFTAPVKYRAVPIRDGIAILKTRDKKEREKLYKKTESLMQTLVVEVPMSKISTLFDETILITGFKPWVLEIGQTVKNAKESFHSVTFPQSYRAGLFQNGDHYKHCVQRGVECHIAILQSGEITSYNLGDKKVINNPLWKRKFITPIPTNFMLIDNSELFVSLTYGEMGQKFRGLHTTSSCLVTLARDFFDKLWINPTEQQMEI